MSQDIPFSSIEDAISDIRNGKMVIVMDDKDRDNEGELIMAAHFATADHFKFMLHAAKGPLFLSVTDPFLDPLGLTETLKRSDHPTKIHYNGPKQAEQPNALLAQTVQTILKKAGPRHDFEHNGSITLLRAHDMGVLKRAGHTEAAIDLAKLADFEPAGIICKMINDDGKSLKARALVDFATEHQLNLISIQDLIQYRNSKESFIEKIATQDIESPFGPFTLFHYRDTLNNTQHYALTLSHPFTQTPLVRVHSECLTGDIFGSLRCDCGPQLDASMRMIQEAGQGAIIYMKQEGRGIGIANKIRAYKIQEEGTDTVDANLELGFAPDLRDYGVGAQIIQDLGISQMKLITNNPSKIIGLEGYGLSVTNRIPIQIKPCDHNIHYLETKRQRMGHHL